jgi:thermitase
MIRVSNSLHRTWLRRLAVNAGIILGLGLSLILLWPLIGPSAGSLASETNADAPPPTPPAPNRIIVKMRSQPTGPSVPTGYASLDASMASLDVQAATPLFDASRGDIALKHELGLSRVYVLTLPPSTDLQDALSMLSADPAVEYAGIDFVGYGAGTPDDPTFGQQWNLHNTGQGGGEPDADVDAPEAWDISVGVTSTVIAVIDTGVDLNHPDLAAKVVPGYNFVTTTLPPQDDYGHGTHVAGIAAAVTNNATGVAGMCPGCRVMPLKALNSENWGYYSWWAGAVEYAVDNGADVINMSMGGADPSPVLHDAVLYAYNANVPIVAAMMNNNWDSITYYPAVYTETIAVGATDRYDDRWEDASDSGSNYGDHIDLVAPGKSIWSTLWDDTYASWQGTSMATPHVAGVLGLIHAVRPGYTVEELQSVLRATADDQVGPPNEDKKGWDRYFGAGRLNAAHAVQYVVPPTGAAVSGPATGLVLAEHAFIAAVSPITAAQPITYAWQETGQSPVTHTGGLSDTATFTWATSGTQAITVTATNFGGTVTGTQTINVSVPPPDAVLTVCHCGCDYDDIQSAVDAARDGNVIKVATGIYTSVNDYDDLAQVLYISKSVTIRGGYTTAFADPPDPDTNLTTIDAQGGGRVIYVTGDVSPTIEGLRITGGDAAGLGGGQGGNDAGGGVFVVNANPTLRNNDVFSNTAHWGGGLCLQEDNATLIENTLAFNIASHDGGALYLQASDATLSENTIISNVTSHDGGGLYLWESDATSINNVLANNQADHAGAGLFVRASSPRLLHTTIAHNTSGDGSGIYIANGSTVALTNTILVGHTVAVTVTEGSVLRLEATLWGDGPWANTTDWGGAGTIVTGTSSYWDDPAFVDPTAGDYHIQPASVAIDAGVDAGVTTDLDGQPRPLGRGYDIGADEALPHPSLAITKQATPNPVWPGTQLTYTIQVTNTGNVTLSATITDVLPEYVTPDGFLAWTANSIAPGDVWSEQFTVTVETGYSGPLINVAQITTDEGVTGTATNTVVVAEEGITVGPLQGGTIVVSTAGGLTATIEIPAGAVTKTIQLAYTSVPTVIGSPSGLVFAGRAFRLEAYRGDGLLPGLVFEEPVTVTIRYTEADVAGLDENALELCYRDGGEWSTDGIAVVARDTSNHRLVATVAHLSEFATFAKEQQEQHRVYLPLVLR